MVRILTGTLVETGLGKRSADDMVRIDVYKRQVVAAENIVATEEDYEEEIKRMAEGYRMEADKIKELMGEQGKKQIMEDLAVRKAAEFVVNEAKEK